MDVLLKGTCSILDTLILHDTYTLIKSCHPSSGNLELNQQILEQDSDIVS